MTIWPHQSYEIGMKMMQVPVPDGHGKEQLKRLKEFLPELCLWEGPWLAGGTVRRMLMGERVDVADLDFFFPDHSTLQRACKQIERVANAELYTPRASTYRVPVGDGSQIVQFIRKSYYDSLVDVMKSFDFRACQFFTDGETVVFPELALEDAQNKRLRIAYKGELHIEGMLSRLHKYTEYGFRPDPKLIWDSLKKMRRAKKWEMEEMNRCGYSDTKNPPPDPTGLGPAWAELKPKEKIIV
jgi:hypothetical protein